MHIEPNHPEVAVEPTKLPRLHICPSSEVGTRYMILSCLSSGDDRWQSNFFALRASLGSLEVGNRHTHRINFHPKKKNQQRSVSPLPDRLAR